MSEMKPHSKFAPRIDRLDYCQTWSNLTGPSRPRKYDMNYRSVHGRRDRGDTHEPSWRACHHRPPATPRHPHERFIPTSTPTEITNDRRCCLAIPIPLTFPWRHRREQRKDTDRRRTEGESRQGYLRSRIGRQAPRDR